MILEQHTALSVAPTGVEKIHLALDLLEHMFFNNFDYAIIFCTTLQYNAMYRSRKWFSTHPYIIPIEPGDCSYD